MGKQARQRRQAPASSDGSSSVGDAVPWPSAISPGQWVDADGTSAIRLDYKPVVVTRYQPMERTF